MKLAMRALIMVVLGLALVAGPALARDAGLVGEPAPVVRVQAPDTVLVAQQKKRRTLMDMLFGGKEDEQQPQQQTQQQQQRAPQQSAPRTAPKQASLPPPKATIEKADTATRLAVMGDSLAVDLANALERFYADDPNLVIVPMGVGSSSFVRPDFFDWNKTLRDQIDANGFDLAVVVLGINDRQNISADGESYKALSDGWTQAYKQRLAEFVGQFRSANKPLIWVSLPPMQANSYGLAINQISNLQRLAVFGAGAEFLDIYERFLDEEGKYSSFGPDLNGQRVRMRKDDGIHFATAGADKLAFYLSQSIKLFYRGGGSVGLEVADPLSGTDAQLMVRPPFQGLGQIRLLEIAGAVIPLTQTKRAAELILATSADQPGGFDLKEMINAPAGRADAFGVGKTPELPNNPGGR